MLPLTDALSIPESELEERFVRSSGPGGQNVNKVATAVQLRFDAAHSSVLSDDVRVRLRKIAGTRMTDEGVLVIDARRHRTQARNREDARERLAAFIASGLHAPVPRIATRPSRAAKKRRLDDKRERSTIKKARTRRQWD